MWKKMDKKQMAASAPALLGIMVSFVLFGFSLDGLVSNECSDNDDCAGTQHCTTAFECTTGDFEFTMRQETYAVMLMVVVFLYLIFESLSRFMVDYKLEIKSWKYFVVLINFIALFLWIFNDFDAGVTYIIGLMTSVLWLSTFAMKMYIIYARQCTRVKPQKKERIRTGDGEVQGPSSVENDVVPLLRLNATLRRGTPSI